MRVPVDRLACYAALLMTGLLAAVAVGNGGFAAAITDASGYISAGELWRRQAIFRPEPLPLLASWPNAAELAAPLAYRPGPIVGTTVSSYPAGFPMMVAAATSLAGPLGAYLVAPLMGGVLTICAFALGRRVGGDLAGLLAAVLIATSPVVLLQAVHPMSDIPAAVCWMMAWLMALRGTPSAAVTSGLAASMAMLIRPNLAPLAPIIAATVLVGGDTSSLSGIRGWRWRATLMFLVLAALGPALVAWSQAALYGSPFESSYGDWRALFSAANVVPNTWMYLRLLRQAHTWLPLAGLILVPVAIVRTPVLSRQGRIVVLSGTAIVVLNVALYLPLMPFDSWPFLRYLLPALTVLFVLLAGLLAHATRLVWSRARWLALAVPCLAIVVIAPGVQLSAYAINDARLQARIRLMGHYLHEVLPPNAALLSTIHSGALAHYTGRQIVRLDLLDPSLLDQTVDALRLHGLQPVFVLDQALEDAAFRERFASSRFAKLDWPARAVFSSATAIRYFDPADRERYNQGARWPVDVLREEEP